MKTQLIFLFSLLLLINESLHKESSKAVKEEKASEKERPVDQPKETVVQEGATTDQPSDETDIEIPTRPIVPQGKLPEAKIILPNRRIGTSLSMINVAPCGGVIRKEANTLTNKGSNIHVVWETVTPAFNSNCTVKISPGLEREDNFTILYPTGNIANKEGVFPCGKSKGFEGQEFILPEDYVCDRCTLQWKWNTPYGNLYSCSDIIINGEKIGNCLAKCQNGGSCFNGKCLCAEGFYGEFCEDTSESSVDIGLILIIILGCLIGLAILFLILWFVCYPNHSWIDYLKSKITPAFSSSKQELNAGGE